MLPERNGGSKSALERKLEQYRDTPVDSFGTKDSDFLPLLSYLLKVKLDKDGALHWFCSHADDLTRETATFLLRMFAYENAKVTEWKDRLRKVWSTCAECIMAMDIRKRTSRTTYFGAFTDNVITRFWAAFENFEVQTIVEAMKSAESVAEVPPVVMYHLLSKVTSLRDTRILHLFDKRPFWINTERWPTESLPSGVLLLTTHAALEVRDWAKSCIEKGKEIGQEYFTVDQEIALEAIIDRISHEHVKNSDLFRKHSEVVKDLNSSFNFSQVSSDIWSGLASCLQVLLPEVIMNSSVHRVVINHLHDTDNHFPEVLRCTVHIVKKLDNKIWEGEGDDYPQVVFDSIKDNPAYVQLVENYDPSTNKPWFLYILSDYLVSVWDLSVFEITFAKFVAFMCEELQHVRFKEKRPFVMLVTMKILVSLLSHALKTKAFKQYQLMAKVLDIHSDLIAAVALSCDYDKEEWRPSRRMSITLLKMMMAVDVDQVANTIVKLTEMEPTITPETVMSFNPPTHLPIWKKVYANMQTKDAGGLSLMICLAARSSRIDHLVKKVVASRIWNHYKSQNRAPPTEVLYNVDLVVNTVNNSLDAFRDGLLPAVVGVVEDNAANWLLAALREKDMVKELICMMCSPIENVHVAAQTVVGQAFDVDGRPDCFRVLFSKMPGPSFRGLRDYVEKFNLYAVNTIEACSASKALVRCLTDVLEVLGNSPDGLLKDERYVKKNCEASTSFKKDLSKLWVAMTVSISVIFRRTPRWAIHFENKAMLEWMRDALIFARDLLAHRGSFEVALLIASGQDPSLATSRKLSSVGKEIVNDLQDVLLALQNWLRLTDEELLYQAFTLLKAMLQCFRETGVRPSDEALTKLRVFVDANRSQAGRRISILNQASLSELEIALADFEDDEVQIISVSKKPAQVVHKEESPEVVVVPKPNKPVEDLQKGFPKHLKQTKLNLRSKESLALSSTIKKLGKPTDNVIVEIPLSPVKHNFGSRAKFEGSTSAKAAPKSRPVHTDTETSGSSDSDDYEGGEKGLGMLTALQKSPVKKKVKPPVERRPERRQMQIIDDPKLQRGVRNAMQERHRQQDEARRNAMRLKPDITGLHRMILSWDYNHKGPEPPYKGRRPQFLRVPDLFMNHGEYSKIFEPLLMLECWAQLIKSKEEPTLEVYDCTITSRQFVDDWLDLELLLVEGPKKDVRLTPEIDIILLKQAAGDKCIMGKVLAFKNTSHLGLHLSVRCSVRSHESDPGLSMNSRWRLSLVFSLSTLHREFAALVALPYYDLAELIFKPKLQNPVRVSPAETQSAMSAYQVNKPQAEAILSSMRTNGFSLIQGPPGTGKTWTICGLVGAFLSTRRRPATAIVAGRAAGSAQNRIVPKILICAPSNAAIDEVAKRLVDGVRDSQGQRVIPKVVRVGADNSMNISVKDISLDALVDQKISTEGGSLDKDNTGNDLTALRTEINAVKDLRQKKIAELNGTIHNTAKIRALDEEIKSLGAKRISLSQRLDKLRDKQKSEGRSLDAIRRRYRLEVLAEVDVVCSTLSGAGHEQLADMDFEMVIIDEAAQAIELSSLIPLKYRCNRCIMVGDPQQLPPTVLSPEASKWGYDQSLFVRMQKQNPNAVHLLSIQYRMHPEISLLPSRVFYDGRLRDGPEMKEKTAKPWHNELRLGVYKFFSAMNGREEPGRSGHSYFNREECNVAVAIYNRLLKQFSSFNFDYRIGVVSMYRSQVAELRLAFKSRFGQDVLTKVDFNTVDGFQGQEKDIIILSCVRAGPSLQTVGFLADVRRINVAITRSRSSLFIIGNAPTLERSDITWKNIIEDARSRSCYIELTDNTYFTTREPEIKKPVPSQKKQTPQKAPSAGKDIEMASPVKTFTPKGIQDSLTRSNSVRESNQKSSQNNHIASSSKLVTTATGQKRPRDEREDVDEKRSAPALRANAGAGQKRPIAGTSHPPMPLRPPVDEAAKRAAERELQALKQRKKKNANNPFIKR